MKCVQHRITKEIRRVLNEEARRLVGKGEWLYIPKRVWKLARRAHS